MYNIIIYYVHLLCQNYVFCRFNFIIEESLLLLYEIIAQMFQKSHFVFVRGYREKFNRD